MSFPAWNDPQTSLAYYDNIPVQYPPPPGYQATKPSTQWTYYAKMPMDMDVVHICVESDVDTYLVPSLTGYSQIPVMAVVDNENPNAPPGDPANLLPCTVWQGTSISGEAFTEPRRPWVVVIPKYALPPPEGMDYTMMPNCQVLLKKMMAHGVGAPGYWSVITDKKDPRYVTAMMETSGLWWTFF